MKQHRGLVAFAALSGALAVAAGAFAAHGTSGSPARWLHTGAEYQLLHAVGALAALNLQGGKLAAILFLFGGLVFAGTLYAMALGAPLWLGAVTPIGGMGFILGWILLALAALR
jgi:uncharacterized membrane protein YgdD (TMEM256/DUF423 family)